MNHFFTTWEEIADCENGIVRCGMRTSNCLRTSVQCLEAGEKECCRIGVDDYTLTQHVEHKVLMLWCSLEVLPLNWIRVGVTKLLGKSRIWIVYQLELRCFFNSPVKVPHNW